MPNGTPAALSSPTAAPPPDTQGGVTRAKRLLPWAVALVASLWVLQHVLGLPPDPVKEQKLLDACHRLPVAKFLVASAVLLTLNLAADAFAMFYTFRWFGCRLPYREVLIARGATYILAVVQYYVGQAAVVAFLHRRRGVELMRATGWILFISAINMGVLVLLAAIGLAGGTLRAGSGAGASWLTLVPLGVAAGAIAYAGVLAVRPAALVRIRLLEPLFEMGVVGHVKAVGVRLPHVLVLIVWHYLALRWFGVSVPPSTALVLLPAVFFAAALPISVQGLGLSQAAAVFFFARYAVSGEAAVLAYSLSMTAVSLIVQVAIGLAFLPAGRRLGFASPPETAVAGDLDFSREVPAPRLAIVQGGADSFAKVEAASGEVEHG